MNTNGARTDLESRAELEFMNGQIDVACQMYSRLLETDPANTHFLERQCDCLIALGDFPRAQFTAQELIRLEPRVSAHHAKYAHICRQRGDMISHRRALQTALKLDPTNISLQLEASRAYAVRLGTSPLVWPKEATGEDDEPVRLGFSEIQRNKRMIAILDRILWHMGMPRETKRGPETDKMLGNTALRNGNIPDALRCYDRAIRSTPANLSYWNCRAAALMKMGKHEEAIKALEEGLRHGKESPPELLGRTWRRIGTANMKMHKLDLAIAAFEKSVAEYDDPKLRHEIIRLRKLQKTLTRNPETAAELADAGSRLMADGQHREAVEHFERAISFNSKDPVLYTLMAEAKEELNELSDARRACEKALKYSTDDETRERALVIQERIAAKMGGRWDRLRETIMRISGRNEGPQQAQPEKRRTKRDIQRSVSYPRRTNSGNIPGVQSRIVANLGVIPHRTTSNPISHNQVESEMSSASPTIPPELEMGVAERFVQENQQRPQAMAYEQPPNQYQPESNFAANQNFQAEEAPPVQNAQGLEWDEVMREVYEMWKHSPDEVRQYAAADPYFEDAVRKLREAKIINF